jgi:hypothetical protein
MGDKYSVYRGAIRSRDLQYARKASDFQQPSILTTSGGTPRKRSSVVPPIWKECPVEDGYVFAVQMELHSVRNFRAVRQTWPLPAQYENRG